MKLFAISLPAFLLVIFFVADPDRTRRSLEAELPPRFELETSITVSTDVVLEVAAPVHLEASGVVNGQLADGTVFWSEGMHSVEAGTELVFPRYAAVPVVEGAPAENASWLTPQDDGDGRGLFATYSLIIAAFLGTMGLPHILVRFYTNPSGQAARRTTLFVLMLLGLFFLFPTIFGALSRIYVPQLLVTGSTDAAVLLLPGAMVNGWPGYLLGAVTAAGAFAAFVSTASALVACAAGVVATDVLRRGSMNDFRLAAVVSALIPVLGALYFTNLSIAQSVGMVMALAAATFCPLLVLGVWWRGLTATGAMVGMSVGGGLTLLSMALTMVMQRWSLDWLATITAQPALITVPAAFLTMVVVSRATARQVPPDVSRILLRMHAPDRLGLMQDRDLERFGFADEPKTESATASDDRGAHEAPEPRRPRVARHRPKSDP